jgi:hypothetical protein
MHVNVLNTVDRSICKPCELCKSDGLSCSLSSSDRTENEGQGPVKNVMKLAQGMANHERSQELFTQGRELIEIRPGEYPSSVAAISFPVIIRPSTHPSSYRDHTCEAESVRVQVSSIRACAHPSVRALVLPPSQLSSRDLGH